ncbi:MAG: EAL domain-containing protein (putative c-di-GMP-specific phosphodiesterase class I) [Gammaproteobacteria bacterium]
MAGQNAGTLLIVDDEEPVRRALERLLRRDGYKILSAGDAGAAAHLLETTPVDVILCDQDMPGLSGTQFLMETANRYPNQRRMMISGRFQSQDVAEAIDAGAIHKFMMKPWDDNILSADVRASFRQLFVELQGESVRESPIDLQVEWQRFGENRLLTRELHDAPDTASLWLAYQPRVQLEDGSVCGFEALLRWQSSLGAISPARFIGLAEKGGAMSQITRWVVREAVMHASSWAKTAPTLGIGINVSPTDLRDAEFAHFVRDTLAEAGVNVATITIEITESQAPHLTRGMMSVLEQLADLGVCLAIDDFGAGATSLGYLSTLPFRHLKLDRSLVEQLHTEKGKAVVAKILELSHCLGMTTTVEGLETETQFEIARSLGAEIGQGYYFSPPQNVVSVERWLNDGCPGFPR